MKAWWKSGSPWIWLNAGAAALCLVMVIGLIMVIAVRGLAHFWPQPVLESYVQDPAGGEVRVLGSHRQSETVTAAVVRDSGIPVPEDQAIVTRHLIQLGNRDITGRDFLWYVDDLMSPWTYPEDALVLERSEWGNFYGYLLRVLENGDVVGEGEAAWEELFPRVERARELRIDINDIERYEIGNINYRIEQLRLDERRLQLRGDPDPAEAGRIARQRQILDERYAALEAERRVLYERLNRDSLVALTAQGDEVVIPIANVMRATRPNTMGLVDRLGHYVDKLVDFVAGYPREANTEGGIFPAIFGTVMMVLLMSVIVTPVGVLAAIYLREYARQGPLTRLVRICVNNLAGVPSIVFGVFGLGFFVYWLGGSIDRLLYPEALPAPTFGTPGLFWASLTLALLTLPVVIVSTEEGLTRIPRSIREGSLALGATKAETLWRTVVPMAAPAMMTGLILAVARAAGEVAPLMLVGVVKLAPNLPVDGNPPFIHLERKLMHLGFHIYDVGFQSPNVEAARPLVYATALTLILIIIVLNLTAIAIRNRLREKYKSEAE
jgi:phosphate transport system permease protein